MDLDITGRADFAALWASRLAIAAALNLSPARATE
jgi:hypothetical protein